MFKRIRLTNRTNDALAGFRWSVSSRPGAGCKFSDKRESKDLWKLPAWQVAKPFAKNLRLCARGKVSRNLLSAP
jgi:hypothetical protein